jgi:hypothetical protein
MIAYIIKQDPPPKEENMMILLSQLDSLEEKKDLF